MAKGPSAAVLGARARRRGGTAGKRVKARLEWFGDQVEKGIVITMKNRVNIVAQLVRDKTVVNISKPVGKAVSGGGRGPSGRFRKRKTRVDPGSRSKPGEFPRADTTTLMKSIFWDTEGSTSRKIANARIGTTTTYGPFLESRMNRSFLRRTLFELESELKRILIPPGGDRRLVFK